MTTLRPRSGRFVVRDRTVSVPQMSRCVPGCRASPSPLLCETHWPLVTSATRRALVAEFKAIEHGRHKPGPALTALVAAAHCEAQRALYRAGVAPR